MDRNVKFTGEELTELEDIILGTTIDLILERRAFNGRSRIEDSEEALKAFSEQEKLLKSLHHKIQLMCIAYSEKELFAEEVQGLTSQEIWNNLSDKKWEDKYADYLIDNAKSIDINKLTEE